MRKFFKFLKESKEELTKVVWPTRKQTIEFTIAVIIIVVFVGVFLGGADYILTKAMTWLLKK